MAGFFVYVPFGFLYTMARCNQMHTLRGMPPYLKPKGRLT
jgi:hypothetical protein